MDVFNMWLWICCFLLLCCATLHAGLYLTVTCQTVNNLLKVQFIFITCKSTTDQHIPTIQQSLKEMLLL